MYEEHLQIDAVDNNNLNLARELKKKKKKKKAVEHEFDGNTNSSHKTSSTGLLLVKVTSFGSQPFYLCLNVQNLSLTVRCTLVSYPVSLFGGWAILSHCRGYNQ